MSDLIDQLREAVRKEQDRRGPSAVVLTRTERAPGPTHCPTHRAQRIDHNGDCAKCLRRINERTAGR